MNFSVQSIVASLQKIWQRLDKRQRIITIVVPVAVLSLLLTLVWWAGRPDYTPLFQGQLSAQDAGAVVTELKNLKIPYQLSDGGTTILVPKAQIGEARIDLASAGVPQGSKFNFDYLNNNLQFGETDSDRQVQYTLALQGELENTLKTLSPVDDATVQLVIPNQSLYTAQQQNPTAAVTIKLKPAQQLTTEQIRSIANLLASSVQGLKPGNVTIVDTNGQLLSQKLNTQDSTGLSNNQLQMQQTVEHNLEQAAQSMLDQAFGPGKSIVRVAPTLNFDQVATTSETFGPGTLLSKQSQTEVVTGGTGAGGVAGSSTNIPGYQSVTTTGAPVIDNKSNITENYDVTTTEQQRIANPGAIQQLSVSVLLDASSVKPQTVQAVKNLVTTAVGLNTQRGDQIQVVAIPFNNQYLASEQAAMLQNAQKRLYTEYAIAGVVVFAILITLLLVWLKRRKQAQEELLLREAIGVAPIAASSDDDLNKPAEDDKYKQIITKAGQANPEEVANVIKLWLREE